MPCYKPLKACQREDGTVLVGQTGVGYRDLLLPCNRCIGCRLERSRQWAMRCMHENKTHKSSCFVTLTYDEDKLPHRGQLMYRDYQLFMKRLRKSHGSVRFYMCGEYGSEYGRPHFHSLLFGWSPDDRVFWKSSGRGDRIYTSNELDRLWTHGRVFVGAVTFESAAYVARYCVAKVTGDEAKTHYRRVDSDGEYWLQPEFNQMSLKPGIGAEFYRKYRSDMYPHGKVVVNGKEMQPPKYYDNKFKQDDYDSWLDMQVQRELDAWDRRDDNVPERLAVKEEVAHARATFSFNQRSFDG